MNIYINIFKFIQKKIFIRFIKFSESFITQYSIKIENYNLCKKFMQKKRRKIQ